MKPLQHSQVLKLTVLLLVFVAGVLAHQAALPTLEGNDEALHYNYAVYVRETHQLPDRNVIDKNTTQQETGQPPLTYVVDAVLFDLLKLPNQSASDAEMSPERNRW